MSQLLKIYKLIFPLVLLLQSLGIVIIWCFKTFWECFAIWIYKVSSLGFKTITERFSFLFFEPTPRAILVYSFACAHEYARTRYLIYIKIIYIHNSILNIKFHFIYFYIFLFHLFLCVLISFILMYSYFIYSYVFLFSIVFGGNSTEKGIQVVL